MKKTMLFIIVIACGSFLKLSAQCIDTGDHLIGLGQSADFIWKYMKEYEDNAKNKGGWADFNISHFAIYKNNKELLADPKHCGQYFYFLYNDVTKKFYLGTEPTANLNSTNQSNPQGHDALDPQDKIREFSEQEGSFTADVFSGTYINFLQKLIVHKVTPVAGAKPDDAFSNVDRRSNQFTLLFQNPGDQVYPRGFFHKNQFFKLINTQGCEGIRFYWGYDSSVKSQSARIHIIAVPIDSTGKNIIDGNNVEQATILEQSWPPY